MSDNRKLFTSVDLSIQVSNQKSFLEVISELTWMVSRIHKIFKEFILLKSAKRQEKWFFSGFFVASLNPKK